VGSRSRTKRFLRSFAGEIDVIGKVLWLVGEKAGDPHQKNGRDDAQGNVSPNVRSTSGHLELREKVEGGSKG